MTDELGLRTRKLVSAIYKQTVSGQIAWQQADFSNTVEASVGDLLVQVTQFSDEFSDESQYIMFVKGKDGTVRDRIDQQMLVPPTKRSPLDFDVSDRLERIYFEAKRRASGAGETVDALLNALGEE